MMEKRFFKLDDIRVCCCCIVICSWDRNIFAAVKSLMGERWTWSFKNFTKINNIQKRRETSPPCFRYPKIKVAENRVCCGLWWLNSVIFRYSVTTLLWVRYRHFHFPPTPPRDSNEEKKKKRRRKEEEEEEKEQKKKKKKKNIGEPYWLRLPNIWSWKNGGKGKGGSGVSQFGSLNFV